MRFETKLPTTAALAVMLALGSIDGRTQDLMPPAPHQNASSSSLSGWVLEYTDTYTPTPVPEPEASNAAPTETNSLIDRLANQFTWTIPERPRTDQQQRWFERHPDYLVRVFERARPYLHHIVSELEAHDMPLELALLPIVESAFDPFAYSHGRAAGLWQIIPGTGRRFGLQQNWWYDGRRDVIAATDAALQYLRFLAERYDGDYELAVAAYNSGEGTVDRAIRRNRKAGKATDFWALSLPKETASYVPKLHALVRQVRSADERGLELPHIDDRAVIASVATGGQIDLALAAELADISVAELYALNPGFNQWATAPKGPHRLVVPIATAPSFTQQLDALPANQRMRWKRHQIADGETLSHIAEQYAISTATIRDANNLRGSMIRAGQYLLIPTATRPMSDYTHTAAARLQAKQSRNRGGGKRTHTVTAGESLWTIAQRYNVSTRSLASWNGMAPKDTLSVGRKLVVWQQTTGGVADAASGANMTRKLRYTVRTGDSLDRIANRFRITVRDIARWNKLDINRILRPGQRLTLFVDVRRQSS
ncbi:MAG: LysM peptidoglycan-binding domain-containing protein [Pseudomonadota bacterium]